MEIRSEGYAYALFATVANKTIIRELEAKSARVFEFPAIETERVDLNPIGAESIENLTDFDWIIFPDVLAVDHLVETMRDKGFDPFDLDLLRVLASGGAVADRLRFSELHADLIAHSSEPETAFSELLDYLAGEDPAELRFLITGAESHGFELAGQLRDLGAVVTELPVYRIICRGDRQLPKLKALITGGAIDEFIFSDPVDLLALRFYFPGINLIEILGGMRISATDQIMFQALKEAGLAAKVFRAGR